MAGRNWLINGWRDRRNRSAYFKMLWCLVCWNLRNSLLLKEVSVILCPVMGLGYLMCCQAESMVTSAYCFPPGWDILSQCHEVQNHTYTVHSSFPFNCGNKCVNVTKDSRFCTGLGISTQQCSPDKKAILALYMLLKIFRYRRMNRLHRVDVEYIIEFNSSQKWNSGCQPAQGKMLITIIEKEPRLYARHETFSTFIFLMYWLTQTTNTCEKYFILDNTLKGGRRVVCFESHICLLAS